MELKWEMLKFNQRLEIAEEETQELTQRATKYILQTKTNILISFKSKQIKIHWRSGNKQQMYLAHLSNN